MACDNRHQQMCSIHLDVAVSLNGNPDCDFGCHNKGIMGADCVRVESFLEFLGVIQI